MTPPRQQILLLGGILLAGAVSAGMGAWLTGKNINGESGSNAASVYILGPARSLLSAGLYRQADVYFHKGVPAHKDEAFHGFFQKWKEAITPVKHAHASDKETLEIMPWLRLATQSDPHNIEAYLVAAFWLNGEGKSPALALEVIEEAIQKNPGHYEIYLEKGRLYLSNGEFQPAEEAFQTALTMLTHEEQSDPEQASIDMGLILMVQSYLFEVQGNRDAAIAATRQYLQRKPENQLAQERLAHLQSEPLNPDAATSRLKELFSNPYVCSEEEHDHEEHGHEDEHGHVHGPDCNH